MNEDFGKWWEKERYNMGVNDKPEFRKCWNAAIESTKEKRFGCVCDMDDLCHGITDCDFDFMQNPLCIHAKKLIRAGKSKTDCSYWGLIDG